MLRQFRQLPRSGVRRLGTATVHCKAATIPVVDKAVGYWLLGCGGLVAGMVSVGGMTRLTKSGLSMTEWNLTGRRPPMNDEEWLVEFERYKTFPEWQQRQSMTLDEFKYIFFWEYGHRQLGRGVGVAFAVPLAYFLGRGRIPPHLKSRMAALLGLGTAQGLVGAWMVQSGLDMDPKQRAEIRVSPYRLATHLGMAFTTYALLLWTALDVLRPHQEMCARTMTRTLTQTAAETAAAAAAPVPSLLHALDPRVAAVRVGSALTAALVFTTAVSGAFVAGNDAGRAYNTFPTMDGRWVPPSSVLFELTPKWRNAFENTATVQLDHRLLALASTLGVAGTLAAALGKGMSAGRALPSFAAWPHLPKFTQRCLAGMGGMVCVQVSLGISTLLLYVPLELAAAHQLGSLALLTFSTAAAHSLRGASAFVALSHPAPVGGMAAPAVAVAGVAVLAVPAVAAMQARRDVDMAK